MTAERAIERQAAIDIGIHWDVRSSFGIPEALFVEALNRDGLRHLRRETFPLREVSPPSLAKVGEELFSIRHARGETIALRLADRGVALLELGRGSATVEIAAQERDVVDELVDKLSQQLGAAEERDDEVAMNFWALAQHGPKSARRRVSAPQWSEIAANYSQPTAIAVAKLITARVPAGGRLVLWHGEPGTGKTHALRALSHVWSDWCSTHFITDPEAFLGHGTSYLLDVLTSEDSVGVVNSPSWKLVVLEDSGELLSIDAHERTGQALSRLLNVTDGVLGQGMKAIVLVTTNEPLGRLHPAIQRPGRCWREIEFRPLDVREANQWLAAHDSTVRLTAPAPLAELYGVLRGRKPEPRRQVGFAAS